MESDDEKRDWLKNHVGTPRSWLDGAFGPPHPPTAKPPPARTDTPRRNPVRLEGLGLNRARAGHSLARLRQPCQEIFTFG